MSKIRVLNVDDSALMRQILAICCRTIRHTKWSARRRSATSPREQDQGLNPDVITLDVEMPKMDRP